MPKENVKNLLIVIGIVVCLIFIVGVLPRKSTAQTPVNNPTQEMIRIQKERNDLLREQNQILREIKTKLK